MAHANWSYWNALRRLLLAGTAVTVLCGASVTARAENATINEIRYEIPPTNFPSTIYVSSQGGQKWDTIEPGNVLFGAIMIVDTAWPGHMDLAGIFLGRCENQQCGNGYPLVYFDSSTVRDYNKDVTVNFATSKIPVSGPGIAVVPYGDEILKTCNDHLTADGPTREHTFIKQMTTSFSVNTRKTVGEPAPGEVWNGEPVYNGGEITRYADFTAKVICRAKPMQQTAELRVGNIELFQSTYANQTSRPNPGTECKKVRVLVRLETNREGPVKFDLWTRIGDGPSSRKFVEAWSSPAGSGYQAEYAEWVEVTKTTVVQSMAEDKTNPIGQSTGWKDITLHCTGAGGGGLADAPRQPTSSTPPMHLVAQTGQTPPTISCIGGLSTGSTCVCRQPTVKVQTGPNAYRCVMDGLTAGNGSNSAPQRLVGPASTTPGVSCIGGVLNGSTCTCRPPAVKVATGLHAWRCVMDGLTTGNGSAPQRLVGPANTAPPSISCIGGVSTGTACFCRPPTVKVQTGPNAFRCVMDGMTTGNGHPAPFVNRFDNRPRIMIGPGPVHSGQPHGRPMFDRQSALPPRGMFH
jgi:hypothetical protein